MKILAQNEPNCTEEFLKSLIKLPKGKIEPN